MDEKNDSDVTTIQISNNLRIRLRVACAKKDITYEKLLEELLDKFEKDN